MTGVGRLYIIFMVAAVACVWGIVVIPVVAGRAVIGNRCVCAINDPVIIVLRESRRRPTGIGSVTLGAIR